MSTELHWHAESRGVVLIAEGHGALRALSAVALRDAGFETVEADTVDSAFNFALTHRPYVVLASCDSAFDGIELAHTLARHAETRTIPVILLADSAQQDLGLVADDARIHAVLSRPCPQEELLAHVKLAVAYSLELRQILVLAPSRPVRAPGERVAAPPHRETTVFPCPNCGEVALSWLGETRYSIVLRCTGCHEVSVERRSQSAGP